MTAVEWLLAREPAPPASLAARLRSILGDGAAAEPSAEVYLRAGERLLAELLRDGCADRESALDLLAADALVTYAFEVASERPDHVEVCATAAMSRFAALATGSAA